MREMIALVSGGGRGIGGAAVTEMKLRGAHVYSGDVLELSERTSEAHEQLDLDVRDQQSWESALDQIFDQHGRLDILVNAAGIAQPRSEVHDLDVEEWKNVIDVNQTGTMLGMRSSISRSLERGKLSIVNISSIWGLVAGRGQLAYHASKGAVTLMTLNAAVTYADRKIRVNAILPGLIETDMVKDQDPSMRSETISNTPMRRVGEPAEVARAIAFLASDDASYITGALLPVDGGFLAR